GDRLISLYKILETSYNQSGNLKSESLEFSNNKLRATYQELQLIGEELYAEKKRPQRQQELLSLLESLERARVKRRLKEVELQLARAERNHNDKDLESSSEEFRHLTETLKNIG
ncbi:MAG: hypothetical protein ABIG66_02635, partial [Candidatus Kerfeldbacteria bacterium]